MRLADQIATCCPERSNRPRLRCSGAVGVTDADRVPRRRLVQTSYSARIFCVILSTSPPPARPSHGEGCYGEQYGHATSDAGEGDAVKMRRFTYHQPTNIDEGLSLLSSHGADAKVIAGGQSLLPMMAMRLSSPAHLIDVARMGGGLDTIGADDGSIGIGANVSHSSVAASQMVEQSVPLLTRAAPMIGHRAIRNRGTLCGSIAHADLPRCR